MYKKNPSNKGEIKVKGIRASLLWLLVLVTVLTVPSLRVGALPSETDDGIFYSVKDGEVTVEGFNAVGHVMHVPEQIEGMTVKYIAPQACRADTVITEVILPKTIVSIGEYAFAECPNLVKVTLSGTETIGFGAFRLSPSLATVILPDTLKVIEDEAFYGCIMLGSVTAPASLEAIGTDVFLGCDRLILDVSESPLAKAYAEEHGIPTSFFESWTFTVLMLAVSTVLLLVLVLLVRRYLRKRRPLRPAAKGQPPRAPRQA